MLPAITKALKSARDGDRATLLLAIGNHGNPKAVKSVLPYLSDKNDNVRFSAVYALGRLGDPSVLKDLDKLRNDRDPSVRWQAKQSQEWVKQMVGKYPNRLTDKDAWWNE